MLLPLKYIGKKCKEYRVNAGYYQYNVSHDTGYSIENVSSFENGRNDNARILLWYFERGMTYDYLRGDYNG